MDVVERASKPDARRGPNCRGFSNEEHHTSRPDRYRGRSGDRGVFAFRGSGDRLDLAPDLERRIYFGASGGSGVLTFEGRQYRLSVGGISAGATIGASGADLVGTASHLHSAADIQGIYSAVGAGLSVAGGRQAARLSNANGVILRLRGRQIGFMFSLDLSGMQISLA